MNTTAPVAASAAAIAPAAGTAAEPASAAGAANAVRAAGAARRADASSAQYGIALLRIALGVMWIAHALLKLLVFTLPGTASFFESVGFAGWLAYPVFAAELVGGLALVVGAYGRQAALALVPVMAVAAWVHLPNGWVHTSAGGGWEYPVFLIVASIAQWLMGDGALSWRRSPLLAPRLP